MFKQSLVRILKYRQETENINEEIVGTGFLINKEGWIATCWHNIDNSITDDNTLRISFYANDIVDKNLNEKQYTCFNIKLNINRDLLDREGDLALFKVSENLPNLSEYTGFGYFEPHSKFETYSLKETAGNEYQPDLLISFGSGEILRLVDTKINNVEELALNSNDITEGFSGAPIFDLNNNYVVGLVKRVELKDGLNKRNNIAYGIPAEYIKSKADALGNLNLRLAKPRDSNKEIKYNLSNDYLYKTFYDRRDNQFRIIDLPLNRATYLGLNRLPFFAITINQGNLFEELTQVENIIQKQNEEIEPDLSRVWNVLSLYEKYESEETSSLIVEYESDTDQSKVLFQQVARLYDLWKDKGSMCNSAVVFNIIGKHAFLILKEVYEHLLNNVEGIDVHKPELLLPCTDFWIQITDSKIDFLSEIINPKFIRNHISQDQQASQALILDFLKILDVDNFKLERLDDLLNHIAISLEVYSNDFKMLGEVLSYLTFAIYNGGKSPSNRANCHLGLLIDFIQTISSHPPLLSVLTKISGNNAFLSEQIAKSIVLNEMLDRMNFKVRNLEDRRFLRLLLKQYNKKSTSKTRKILSRQLEIAGYGFFKRILESGSGYSLSKLKKWELLYCLSTEYPLKKTLSQLIDDVTTLSVLQENQIELYLIILHFSPEEVIHVIQSKADHIKQFFGMVRSTENNQNLLLHRFEILHQARAINEVFINEF